MHSLHVLLLALIFQGLVSTAAIAQSDGTMRADGGSPEPTRITVDRERDEIRFFIKGKVAAVLRADGLHVRESIGYGGTLTDYGRKGFGDFTGHVTPRPEQEEGSANAE